MSPILIRKSEKPLEPNSDDAGDGIKPEPPSFIKNIKWFSLYWKKGLKYILLAIFIIGLIAAYNNRDYLSKLFSKKPLVKPPSSEIGTKASPSKKPAELTLLHLFENDFNNLYKFSKEGIYLTNEGLEIKFKAKEYLDFAAKSKFIGFYIPSTPLTFAILVVLPEKYQDFSSKGKVSMEAGQIGLEPVDKDELEFTGRVFIYHETPIFESKKRELYTLYEKYNLSPQFRGIRYLFEKKEIKKAP